jgi:hypothetical protein
MVLPPHCCRMKLVFVNSCGWISGQNEGEARPSAEGVADAAEPSRYSAWTKLD